VAEIAHPTTFARLIGRSAFSGIVRFNFLRAEIPTAHSSKLVRAFVKPILSLGYRPDRYVRRVRGCWPRMLLFLIIRCTPTIRELIVATPLSETSPSTTGLSALAPAQRAGAQRLCALAQTGGRRSGRACPLCPGISDINLFSYCEGIIYLDAEISDRTFDLGMSEQSCAIIRILLSH